MKMFQISPVRVLVIERSNIRNLPQVRRWPATCSVVIGPSKPTPLVARMYIVACAAGHLSLKVQLRKVECDHHERSSHCRH